MKITSGVEKIVALLLNLGAVCDDDPVMRLSVRTVRIKSGGQVKGGRLEDKEDKTAPFPSDTTVATQIHMSYCSVRLEI